MGAIFQINKRDRPFLRNIDRNNALRGRGDCRSSEKISSPAWLNISIYRWRGGAGLFVRGKTAGNYRSGTKLQKIQEDTQKEETPASRVIDNNFNPICLSITNK